MSIAKHKAAYEHHKLLANGHHVKAEDIKTEGPRKMPGTTNKIAEHHRKVSSKHQKIANMHKRAIKKLGGKVKEYKNPFANHTPVKTRQAFKPHNEDKWLHPGIKKSIDLANDMINKLRKA